MSRRDALYRLAVGVIYLPLYWFVIFPTVLIIGLLVAGVDVVYALVTGGQLTRRRDWATRSVEKIDDPVRYVLSGDERSRPDWLP